MLHCVSDGYIIIVRRSDIDVSFLFALSHQLQITCNTPPTMLITKNNDNYIIVSSMSSLCYVVDSVIGSLIITCSDSFRVINSPSFCFLSKTLHMGLSNKLSLVLHNYSNRVPSL